MTKIKVTGSLTVTGTEVLVMGFGKDRTGRKYVEVKVLSDEENPMPIKLCRGDTLAVNMTVRVP
jgi:hypothetical protein